MTVTQQRMTCKCGHVFEAEVVDAPIAVTLASMKAVRCPRCGAGSNEIGIGGGYDDAPPLTASVMDRAAWWRKRGEIGTSSLTIWCFFTEGRNPHRDFNWPLDPDDYRRCKLLLDLIPEWRENLGKIETRFAWFKPFADRWADFETLWAEEAPKKSCSKLYDAMKAACREAEIIRYGKARA